MCRWAVLCGLLLVTTIARAAPAAEAPDAAPPGELEVERLSATVKSLECLRELGVTPAQVRAAEPWLEKAEAARREIAPFERETLRVLKGLLTTARDTLAGGKDLPAALRQELSTKWGELEERRMQVRAPFEMAAWALFQTLTPEQVALLTEPDWRRELRRRAAALLEDVRQMPPAAYAEHREGLARKLAPEQAKEHPQVTEQAAALLEQARVLSDADFAAQKAELLKALMALAPAEAKEAAAEPEAERKEWERRSAVKRLTEVLSAPGVAAALQQGAAGDR